MSKLNDFLTSLKNNASLGAIILGTIAGYAGVYNIGHYQGQKQSYRISEKRSLILEDMIMLQQRRIDLLFRILTESSRSQTNSTLQESSSNEETTSIKYNYSPNQRPRQNLQQNLYHQ